MKKIIFLVLIILLMIFFYLSFFIVPKDMIYIFESKMRGKSVYLEGSVVFCPEITIGLGKIVKIPSDIYFSDKVVLELPYLNNVFFSENYKVELFFSGKIRLKNLFNLLYFKDYDSIIKDVKDQVIFRARESILKNSLNQDFNQSSLLSELSFIKDQNIDIDFKILYFPNWGSYVSLLKYVNKWFDEGFKKIVIEGLEKNYRSKIETASNMEIFDIYFKKAQTVNDILIDGKKDYKNIFEILNIFYKGVK